MYNSLEFCFLSSHSFDFALRQTASLNSSGNFRTISRRSFSNRLILVNSLNLTLAIYLFQTVSLYLDRIPNSSTIDHIQVVYPLTLVLFQFLTD